MSDVNADRYGRNFDGKPGDVLSQSEEMLATRPVKRALLEAVVAEIKRLRAEVSAKEE